MRRRGLADRSVVAHGERLLQQCDRLAIDRAGFGVRHRFPQDMRPDWAERYGSARNRRTQ